jgi:two-component system, NarL family, nitrate/nitrite response regulator NarL
MPTPTKVILVEDNPEYRNVLKLAFEFDNSIELIGIYGSAEHALRALEPKSTKGLIPDILLLDLNLPEMSGLDAMQWFRDYLPKAAIIVITQSEAESDVLTAIQNGAKGYLLKSATVNQIKDSIHTVVDGGSLLDSKVAKYIIAQVQKAPAKDDSQANLSSREMEVLGLLAEGLVKKEIAKKLGISFFTVSTHIRHVYDKLNVINAPAAVSTAYQTGLLPIQKK